MRGSESSMLIMCMRARGVPVPLCVYDEPTSVGNETETTVHFHNKMDEVIAGAHEEEH